MWGAGSPGGRTGAIWGGVGQGGRLQYLLTGTIQDPDSVQDLNYTYDAAGNITQIGDVIAAETSDFTYDDLNRLTNSTLNGGTPETYTYDATTGNLASKAGVNYEYNDAAHKHAVTDAGSSHFVYDDANGNMTQRNVGEQSFRFDYDAENRLVEVSGDLVASFVYDGDGNRLQSTIGGITTRFVGNLYEVGGSTVTKCYYGGAQRAAMNGGGTAYYLLSDHLGSTTGTTDDVGNIVYRRVGPGP